MARKSKTYDAGQAGKVRKAEEHKILKNRIFVHGFKEAKAGISPDYDRGYYQSNADCCFLYEYGRQFAAVYDGPIKIGKKVSMRALVAFEMANRQGTFC